MPSYNTFEQVLKDKKLNEEAKNGFVKKWLYNTYRLDFDSNPGFFTELSRVHDHDQQPKHFGRVLLDTVLGATFVQLVRLPGSNRWRVALSNEDAGQQVPLTPANGNDAAEQPELQRFKAFVTAAPRQAPGGDQGGDVRYGDLNSYAGGNDATGADPAVQQHAEVNPYAIPAFLYDPTYVPGAATTGERVDPSLNKDFEQVVAAFSRA